MSLEKPKSIVDFGMEISFPILGILRYLFLYLKNPVTWQIYLDTRLVTEFWYCWSVMNNWNATVLNVNNLCKIIFNCFNINEFHGLTRRKSVWYQKMALQMQTNFRTPSRPSEESDRCPDIPAPVSKNKLETERKS